MKFIRTIRKIDSVRPNGTTIVYMLGYGGYNWQATRQLNVLKNEGYKLLVMDFVDILERHNPQDLIDLVNEVSDVLRAEKLLSKDTLIVGVSLGALMGYNMIRRHSELDKLLAITGGDMTHIPSPKSLKNEWKLTREQLTKYWKDVNIYTPVGKMNDKHFVMILPKRDKVIDPDEVANEVAKHAHLNDATLIRTNGGHFRAIITETILSPRKRLGIIERLAKL